MAFSLLTWERKRTRERGKERERKFSNVSFCKSYPSYHESLTCISQLLVTLIKISERRNFGGNSPVPATAHWLRRLVMAAENHKVTYRKQRNTELMAHAWLIPALFKNFIPKALPE